MSHIRLRSPTLAALVLLCLPLTVAGQDAGQPGAETVSTPVESLIILSVEAYGGEDALAGASRMIQTGTVTSTMRSGAEAEIVRLYERPVRLRVEIEYPGNESEVRILDGGRGWRNGVPASGPMY
jgi:hypothetical protein